MNKNFGLKGRRRDGGKGGFYLNSIQNLVNNGSGQRNLLKTGKTLNEIQFTMAVIQMQNY